MFKYVKYIFTTIDEFGCSGPLRVYFQSKKLHLRTNQNRNFEATKYDRKNTTVHTSSYKLFLNSLSKYSCIVEYLYLQAVSTNSSLNVGHEAILTASFFEYGKK